MGQARVRAGVPTGGQFAEMIRQEATGDGLVDPEVDTGHSSRDGTVLSPAQNEWTCPIDPSHETVGKLCLTCGVLGVRNGPGVHLELPQGSPNNEIKDVGNQPVKQGQSAKEVIANIFPGGEPNRGLRRHKLLTQELVEQLPGLYQTEDVPTERKLVCAHYFTSTADWHIVEMDKETGEMFGRCDLGMGYPEWGYVSIQDLAELKTQFGLLVERDLDFEPKTVGELGLAQR